MCRRGWGTYFRRRATQNERVDSYPPPPRRFSGRPSSQTPKVLVGVRKGSKSRSCRYEGSDRGGKANAVLTTLGLDTSANLAPRDGSTCEEGELIKRGTVGRQVRVERRSGDQDVIFVGQEEGSREGPSNTWLIRYGEVDTSHRDFVP